MSILLHVEAQHVTVDGQEFWVHDGPSGAIAFDWLNGKNHGYGFASSAPSSRPPSLEELKASIRSFLNQVDPETGYIEAAEPND